MAVVKQQTKVQSYLSFNGRTEEALEFYKKALGAEVTFMMRFKDSPEPCQGQIQPPPGEKIMHASFKIGETELMASDGSCAETSGFQGISLSLAVADEATANSFFKALSEGGQVHLALTKTFFSPCFGMVADKFGVSWMILVASN